MMFYPGFNFHFDHERFYQRDPSSTPEVREPGYSRNRKSMRQKMKGAWQDEPNFFDKFFHLEATGQVDSTAIKERWYTQRGSVQRWKRIPAQPKSASSLIAPLRALLNAIVETSGIPLSQRVFLKPNALSMRASRSPLPVPDLLLAGIGPAFIAPSVGGFPEPEYACGVAPVRIMLESEFRSASRHLSAVHVNEMFLEQDNRRFAYALILTESYLRAFMFDPAGAVVSPRLDYHARPDEFCAVIAGVASLNESRTGFDTSLRCDDLNSSEPRIWTVEPNIGPVSYRILKRLFRASNFMGRATACWLVEPDDNSKPDQRYVIKDAWIATGPMQKDLEASLILHANRQGVVRGLVRIRHAAPVQVPERKEDTVVKNRRIRRGMIADDGQPVQERVHTRIVMEPCGKPLWKFSSRKELLLAFHDAVHAHRDLYLVAGILHRDVSLGNILINPGGEEGDRGVLIDLDLAVRLEHVKTGYRSVGTRKYMSHSLLQNKKTHSYLDDLESFYYVLCWVICEYDAPGNVPGSRISETPELLEEWSDKNECAAGEAKWNHMWRDFELPVQPWFGMAFRDLAMRLHGFFQSRTKPGRPKSHPECDYEDFIGPIKDALEALGPEDVIEPSDHLPTSDHGPDLHAPNSRKRKVDENPLLNEPALKRVALGPVSRVPCVATDRPRRSKANYGRVATGPVQPQPGRRE